MTIRTAEIIEDENGHLLIKAMFSQDEWMTLDLNYCAEHDQYGIDEDWVRWAKGELELQKGLRPDRCETCRVWCELKKQEDGNTQREGECRKRPPRGSQNIDSQGEVHCWLPTTSPCFWCGEWEPIVKETNREY